MEEKLLQQFLEKGLITIERDEDFEKIENAISELTTEIKKTKLTIPLMLEALLGNDLSQPLQKVRDAVTNHWKTFNSKNLSNDKPVALKRVALAALQKASEDINIANLLWLGFRDSIHSYDLGKAEKDIIHSFLNELGNIVENHTAKNNQITSINLKIEKFAGEFDVKLDVEDLKGYLRAASNPEATHKGNSNNNWSFQNNINTGKQWANIFSDIASKGINAFIEDFVKKQTQTTNSFNKQLNKLLQDINEQIVSISKQNSFRSQILWWNKSLYSTSQKATYRKIDDILLPIIMAYDLAQIVPFIYPESVDYLLRETIKEAKTEADKINLKDWLGQIKTHQADIEKVIDFKKQTQDRILLLDFIQEKCAVEDMERRLGIEDAELTLEDLAVWLFHNFQVQNYLDNEAE